MPILTTHKDRLPNHLSYPVGLQTLADALADVPQAEKLSVWFSAGNDRVTIVEKKRRDGDYYTVLSTLC